MSKPVLWFWRIVRILIVVYALACLGLMIFQSRMLYFPQAQIETTPEDAGQQYTPVWIPGADNSKLYAWWMSAIDPSAPTLIYFHGNAGNVSANADQASRLARTCCNVLLFDYRGYGRSSGPFPSEKRIYEDAESAWNYVVNEKKVAPNRIVLYGHSLGTGVAVEMATRHPDAGGLILESAFTSVANRARLEPLYRAFPLRWIVHEKFDSIDKIARVRMPILLIAGTADQTIPSSMSSELYARANDPKQLLLIPGAGHENAGIIGGPKYASAIHLFIANTELNQRLSSR